MTCAACDQPICACPDPVYAGVTSARISACVCTHGEAVARGALRCTYGQCPHRVAAVHGAEAPAVAA